MVAKTQWNYLTALFLLFYFPVFSQVESLSGQDERISKWKEGDYQWWKPYPHGSMSPKYRKMIPGNGMFNLKVVYDEANKAKEVLIDNSRYVQLIVRGGNYVMGYEHNTNYCVYVKEDMLIVYGVDYKGSNVPKKDWPVEKIQFVIGNDLKKKMKKVKVQDLMDEITAYREKAFQQIEQNKFDALTAEKQHKEKYTLKGKEIEKIEFVFPKGTPKYLSTKTPLEVGYQITLKDGDVFRTNNIGGEAFIDEFEIRFDNCGGAVSSISAGSADIGTLDVATFYAKSKYGNSPEIEMSLPIEYDDQITISRNGFTGKHGDLYTHDAGNGSSGGTITRYITTTKHSETGELLYVVLSKEGSRQGSKFKKDAGGIYLSAAGGDGGNGSKGDNVDEDDLKYAENGGDGGNGGNGGLIKVYVDPSAEKCPIRYNVSGGNGGSGGRGGVCFGNSDRDGDWGTGGSAGTEGTFIKKIQKVTIN